MNVASLALMAVVTAQLGRSAIVDVPTASLAAIGAVLLLRFRLNSTWLVLGGAASGALIYFGARGLLNRRSTAHAGISLDPLWAYVHNGRRGAPCQGRHAAAESKGNPPHLFSSRRASPPASSTRSL